MNVELLQRTRDRIADPVHWCKVSVAQDLRGRTTHEMDPDATRWCVWGAFHCERQLMGLEAGATNRTWDQLSHTAETMFDCAIIDLNDAPNHTHIDVLKVLDETLACARRGS